MSWRADLRPASFRGVRFEVRNNGERGGQRGAHHVYPLRNQGWVQQLGLNDRQITLEAYVIGDDFMARRDQLKSALETPGNGELIDPWLGPLQVVVDPNAGWQISHSKDHGRMARFSLNFLIAPAVSTAPDAGTEGVAATDAAAVAVETSIAEDIAARMNLDGIEAVIADARASVDGVFAEIGAARALAQRIATLPGEIVATALAPLAELRSAANALIGLRDAFGGLGTMLDAVSIGIGGRNRVGADTSTPGNRSAVRLPAVSEIEPASARRAALAALDREFSPQATTAEIAANRDAIGAAFDLALVCELARASVREPHAAHGEAIEAMRILDRRIEDQILREADRLAPDDFLIERLTDLRHAAREAILARSADLAPIATVSLGESLPVLAAAWRIHGNILSADDLIERNAVAHPLFAPSDLTTLVPGGRNA